MISVVTITSYSISIRKQKSFAEELVKYFICESTGTSPGKTCTRSHFEGLDPSAPATAISVIVVSLYPLVNLLYVIRLADIKTFLQQITSKCKRYKTPRGETYDLTAMPPRRPATMDLLKGVVTSGTSEECNVEHENTAKENGIEMEPEDTRTNMNVGNCESTNHVENGGHYVHHEEVNVQKQSHTLDPQEA